MGTNKPCIGIDLGTYNSVVGIWSEDEVQIVPNEQGKNTTRSVIHFGPTTTIGGAAVQRAKLDPLNTIFNAKRMLGLNAQHAGLKDMQAEQAVEIITGPATKPAAMKVQPKDQE